MNRPRPTYAGGSSVSCCLVSGGFRRFLFAIAEKRDQRVREIFPSLQIFRHPSITLRETSVHARNFRLAGSRQFGVFLRLFPIALCLLRPAFHFGPPSFTPMNIDLEMGRPDEGAGAKARSNWARSAACRVLVGLGLSKQLRRPREVHAKRSRFTIPPTLLVTADEVTQ
jgi:hypothetical protein